MSLNSLSKVQEPSACCKTTNASNGCGGLGAATVGDGGGDGGGTLKEGDRRGV